jgi:hypothetical protein
MDPVLPEALDGLTCTRIFGGNTLRFTFRVTCSGGTVSRILCGDREIPFTSLSNPYRKGGAGISAETWSEITANGGQITVVIA